MAENSKIEWTDHTFNPWVGCTKISPACDHCYAEGWAKRAGTPELWTGERRRTSASNWQQPVKWNRKAAAEGLRARVFCASLADVFDNQVPEDWRADLFTLIDCTRNLDWLLLTKRPQNIRKMLPYSWGDGWPNVWLGTTVENQAEAERRIPHLLATPARVRFLSCEPLLGPVVLSTSWLRQGDNGSWPQSVQPHTGIDWVICGGESGPGARPMHPHWARSLRDQCAAAGAAFHFKQWGEWAPCKPSPGGDLGGDVRRGTVKIVHPSGRDELAVFMEMGRNYEHGSRYMARVGKKAAGRLLNGVEHNGMPGVTA